jgi:hypothetical protein
LTVTEPVERRHVSEVGLCDLLCRQSGIRSALIGKAKRIAVGLRSNVIALNDSISFQSIDDAERLGVEGRGMVDDRGAAGRGQRQRTDGDRAAALAHTALRLEHLRKQARLHEALTIPGRFVGCEAGRRSARYAFPARASVKTNGPKTTESSVKRKRSLSCSLTRRITAHWQIVRRLAAALPQVDRFAPSNGYGKTMREWLIVVALTMAACAPAAPPVVFVGPEWRSATGVVLSRGEVDAFRQTCIPQAVTTPFDRAQPVRTAALNNPSYRPGGEAIVNAPPIGIAAVDNPIGVVAATTRPKSVPVEDCLHDKGLVRGF